MIKYKHIKRNIDQQASYKENWLLNESLCTFNLQTLIENMKHSFSWAKGNLKAMILMKSSEKQIVLTALQAETEINSFQSNDSITFQIIEGKLNKYKQEVCLLSQIWIKDDSKTIKNLIEDTTAKVGEKIEIKKFARYEI